MSKTSIAKLRVKRRSEVIAWAVRSGWGE